MEKLIADVKFAWRLLARRPLLWVIAGGILALGIGATSAVCSLAWGVLMRPMPYEDSRNLVQLWELRQGGAVEAAPANFTDWRDESRAFSHLSGYRGVDFNLSGNDRPERLGGARVSANFFQALGVGVEKGRSFRLEEGESGRDGVAILSEAAWRRRFGADPEIVGRTLTLDGRPREVIGVLPAEYVFLPLWRAEVYVPLVLDEEEAVDRDGHWLYVIGRLAGGVSRAAAQEEMNSIAERMARRYPATNTGAGVRVVSLRDEITAPIRPVAVILLVAVGAVLLLACGNVAVMLIAAASTRQREVALRISLGARRWRIIRQLLTESLLLSLCGGLIGLAVAYGGLRLFQSLLPPDLATLVVSFFGIEMSPQVAAFTVLLSGLTAVFFGFWPAIKASRPDLAQLLKEEGSRSPKGFGLRGHGFLVAIELVLAVVLLVSAGLLIRSFLSLQALSPKFNSERVLTAALELQEASYPTAASRRAFMQTLQSEIASLPSVESVGAVSILPLEPRNQGTGVLIEGKTPGGVEEGPGASYLTARPGYFRTLGIRLLRGTDFDSRHGADGTPAAVISEALAERLWPGQDPIGKELILTRFDPPIPRQVIGVSENVRYGRLGGPMPSVVYLPYEQDPRSDLVFVLRTRVDSETLMQTVRDRVLRLDETLPVRLRSMADVLDDSVAQARFPVPPLTVFALIALMLAAGGIFGVASFMVSQRRREIGVRVALGASRSDILRLLWIQSLKLALTGSVIGLLCGLGIGRLLASLLHGVKAVDPVVFTAIPLLLFAVTLLSGYLPISRVAKLDPATTLRHD